MRNRVSRAPPHQLRSTHIELRSTLAPRQARAAPRADARRRLGRCRNAVHAERIGVRNASSPKRRPPGRRLLRCGVARSPESERKPRRYSAADGDVAAPRARVRDLGGRVPRNRARERADAARDRVERRDRAADRVRPRLPEVAGLRGRDEAAGARPLPADRVLEPPRLGAHDPADARDVARLAVDAFACRSGRSALALATFLGALAQAPLGAITVYFDLNPWLVLSHFLLSIAILTLARARGARGVERPQRCRSRCACGSWRCSSARRAPRSS